MIVFGLSSLVVSIAVATLTQITDPIHRLVLLRSETPKMGAKNFPDLFRCKGRAGVGGTKVSAKVHGSETTCKPHICKPSRSG